MRQPSLFESHSSCDSDSPAVIRPPLPAGKAGVSHPQRITRRSHPETSLMAAIDTIESGRFAKHEYMAMELVRRHPGRTAAELDRIAGVSDRQIGKRLGGLANRYRLRRGKRRMCEVKGRQCVTWFLLEWKYRWVRLTFPIKLRIRKRRWYLVGRRGVKPARVLVRYDCDQDEYLCFPKGSTSMQRVSEMDPHARWERVEDDTE